MQPLLSNPQPEQNQDDTDETPSRTYSLKAYEFGPDSCLAVVSVSGHSFSGGLMLPEESCLVLDPTCGSTCITDSIASGTGSFCSWPSLLSIQAIHIKTSFTMAVRCKLAAALF